MRHFYKQAQASQLDDSPELEISSLIDVCFLLLIFFLVTQTIQPSEEDLGLQLPQPGALSAPLDDIVIQVKLQADGQVVMQQGDDIEVLSSDSQQRAIPKLMTKLELLKMAAAPHDVVVMLDVEDDAEQQRFVDVLNTMVGGEVNKVTLVTRD